MDSEIGEQLKKLAQAADFEQAAVILLRELLDRAAQDLAISDYASNGHLLRGIVHLRPADGYRGLLVLDAIAGQQQQVEAGAVRTSAKAWRWFQQQLNPILVDVQAGAFAGLDEDGQIEQFDRGQWVATGNEDSTLQHLLDRDATHTLILPLVAPPNQLVGMVAIEACCRQALALEFIWPDCAHDMLSLVTVAAPYLLALPFPVESQPVLEDEYLPVVTPALAKRLRQLKTFVAYDETILLQGPTGIGKTSLARWCHAHSPRAGQPFETVSLIGIGEDLHAGELFGWRKGAFTDAHADRDGALLRAEGGTVFIDEIDKLSLKAQAGLLRVLEDRSFNVLGDSGGQRHADVRFVVATNVDLQQAVAEGRFREDLYYRINVFSIHLPGLDERPEDICPWASYMLHAQAAQHERSAILSADAQLLLQRQAWPGNLRQLSNVLKRALVMALGRPENEAEVMVDAQDIAQGLDMEVAVKPQSGALQSLLAAAEAFVAQDDAHWDLTDAFKGAVLESALARFDTVEAAFNHLGKAEAYTQRNHQKLIKRYGAVLARLRQQ